MPDRKMMTLQKFLRELSLVITVFKGRLVVIRNFEKLPETNIGNDIDLIIREDDIDKWLNAVAQVCVRHELILQVTKQFYYCTKLEISGGGFFLELDLNNRFEWRGVNFFDIDLLIKDSSLHKGPIYTGTRFANAYVTFHHSFLYGGFINYKYKSQYSFLLENISLLQKELSQLGGPIVQHFVIKKMARSKQFSKFGVNCLRSYILVHHLLKSPLKVSVGFIKSFDYSFSK
jgi:hypothetical protein